MVAELHASRGQIRLVNYLPFYIFVQSTRAHSKVNPYSNGQVLPVCAKPWGIFLSLTGVLD